MLANPKHPFGDKIKMIKSLRTLTMVLGKLGLKCLYSSWSISLISGTEVHHTYGFGLLNSKTIVESYIKKKRRTKQETKHVAKLARREARKDANKT